MGEFKTLLLNSSYETLSFISFRRLIKLIVKDKVEIVSHWDGEYISWIDGKIKYPAIIRLKSYVKRVNSKAQFNRRGVFRRDMYICQYCGIALSAAQITIDHIIPVSQGGKSTWDNCCSCCFSCNGKKGDKTPEQWGVKLLKKPESPIKTIITEYVLTKPKHKSWSQFFGDVEYIYPKAHTE